MLKQEDIEAIRDGKWEFAATEMKLKRVDGSSSFCGSGFIRQDKDRRLAFVLLDKNYPDGLKNFFKGRVDKGVKAGEFYPAGHYYILTASGPSGTVWRSAPTKDANFKYGQTEGVVASGFVHELVQVEDKAELGKRMAKMAGKAPKSWYSKLCLRYHICDEIGDYPCNKVRKIKTFIDDEEEPAYKASRCVAGFDTRSYTFRLVKDEGIVTFMGLYDLFSKILRTNT